MQLFVVEASVGGGSCHLVEVAVPGRLAAVLSGGRGLALRLGHKHNLFRPRLQH